MRNGSYNVALDALPVVGDQPSNCPLRPKWEVTDRERRPVGEVEIRALSLERSVRLEVNQTRYIQLSDSLSRIYAKLEHQGSGIMVIYSDHPAAKDPIKKAETEKDKSSGVGSQSFLDNGLMEKEPARFGTLARAWMTDGGFCAFRISKTGTRKTPCGASVWRKGRQKRSRGGVGCAASHRYSVFDLDPEIENLGIEMHFAAKQRVRVGYERLRAVARTCLSEISDTRDAKMYPPPLFDRHATATHRGGVVVKACDPQEAVNFFVLQCRGPLGLLVIKRPSDPKGDEKMRMSSRAHGKV